MHPNSPVAYCVDQHGLSRPPLTMINATQSGKLIPWYYGRCGCCWLAGRPPDSHSVAEFVFAPAEEGEAVGLVVGFL